MKPEREEDSAIIRIGNRSGNKFLRGYEKGKQLLGPAFTAALASEDERDLGDVCMTLMPHECADGVRRMVSMWDWWRLELELKPQTADLPEDIIDRRDQYFAGAYPYLGEVLKDVDPHALVMPRERGPQLDLALVLATIRKQYGSALFTAAHAYDGDIGAVWSKIVGAKHSERLVRAGVLMVDHA
jgi:DNA relaxase NicK